jgi:SagB-type dehydrogenase family enzyme
MQNRNIDEAWRYHNATKHPGMPHHYLDWDNQPIPFKIYTKLDPIGIPEGPSLTGVSALTAISTVLTSGGTQCTPDLRTLGRLLFLSAGITKRIRYPGGEFYFRAAACTGALYHIDLYIVTGDIEGLDAGLYHFGPHDFSLRRLRKGDFRGILVDATGEEPTIRMAPITIVCTTTFWRNSWKYQSRAYRHAFWDNGTILANLLAVASAYGVPAGIVLGFVDQTVNELLGLDTKREVAISLVPLGNTGCPIQGRPEGIDTIGYETMPLSKEEVDYPEIRAIHAASSLTDRDEVASWRGITIDTEPPEPRGRLFPLDVTGDEDVSRISDTIEETILRRGSTRRFARVPITFGQLSNILYRATRGIPADFLLPFGSTLNDIYLIVNDVQGIPGGAYFYHPRYNALELLKEGDFRREAGHLGLGQRIPADASVDVFFLSDLNRVLEGFGNRGYRAAQLEAGILGGKLYIGAYGQWLGASGLTFFDDDVTDFFSPHAAGKSTMFLVALGRSVKRG